MSRQTFYLALALAILAGCDQSGSYTPEQLLYKGRFEEAIEVCTQAIRANPGDAEAYLYRGRAYHCRNQHGDIERAVADFSESIKIAPRNSEAYYSRALAYRDLGDKKKWADDEKLAREFDPRLQDMQSEFPDVTLPLATAEAESEEPDDESAGGKDEDNSGLGKGLGSRLGRPRAMSMASGAAESEPASSAESPLPADAARKNPLDALLKPRLILPPIDPDLLVDDGPGGIATSPLGTGAAQARPRALSAPRTGAPRSGVPLNGLASPFQPRRSSADSDDQELPRQRPLRSPFLQPTPRPTGRVEERPLVPSRSQPRPLYNNPFSVPPLPPAGE